MPVPLKRIVIVGNDDIAWVAATLLAKAVMSPFIEVYLVRPLSPVNPWSTLSHGATLLPETAEISDSSGFDEVALLRATRGNFLTGSVMRDFGSATPGFIPFGTIGESAGQVACHHVIARRAKTAGVLPLPAFMGGAICAQMQRFAPPSVVDVAAQAAFNYGLHIDNERYSELMAKEAVTNSVQVINGSIALVSRDDTGSITAIIIDDGTSVAGDLFVDCGGWLDDEPGTVDWSEWLPCNRIATMRRESTEPPLVSMHLVAHSGGWQRQSSLFGAIVDCIAFCDVVPGDWPVTSTAFRAGRCEAPWRGNCVAIGDGAVVIDPICDVRLHLAMSAIQRIMRLLPAGPDQSVEAREYNRQTIAELDHARDFTIAHYCLNGRTGDPFWDHCRTMAIPESLRSRIDLYRSCGRIAVMDCETQPATAWIALFNALGVQPDHYDSLADLLSPEEVENHLIAVRNTLVRQAQSMPAYVDTANLIQLEAA